MINPPEDSLVGTQLRDYDILELVSRNDSETVYKARDAKLNEDRIIKIIRANSDPEFKNRFVREAEILVGLRHPNLAQTYDFGVIDDQTVFLVVDFGDRETLLKKMEREKLTPRESLGIARQAALGLQLLHEHGMTHLQISPRTLVVVKNEFDEEIIRVTKYSFARPATDRNAEYMSPEQTDSSGEADLRSDIYSLGMTLYHMITGKLPFDTSNLEGYLAKHVNEELDPVSKHVAAGKIPKELDQLILKSLSRNKEDRQTSMAQLIQEIDGVLLLDSTTTAVIHTPPPRMEFGSGFLFADRYLIEKRIGRGGMGTVYKAIDQILEIPVALKTLNKEIAGEERTLKRLKREVILARKVAHPNVCRIYDIGVFEGTPYVSMEFVAGRTLADILHTDGKIQPDVGVPILKQLLLALQEAHRAGVIHRDLKPQNIMVDADHNALIMDFGISISEDMHRLTETGLLIGTPRYMAPEQFGSRNVDHRADIYSIGIIMFEMFTGQLPFEANTPAAVMYAHLYTPPPRPSDLSSFISPELERIILKALEKDPQLRYSTDRELISDLEALEKSMGMATTHARPIPVPSPQQTSGPVVVGPEEPTAEKKSSVLRQQIPGTLMKNPKMFAIGAAIFVVLLAGILLMRAGRHSPPDANPVTQTPKPTHVAPPPAAVVQQQVPKAATTPPAPKPRTIHLVSAPPGASITLDGKETGLQTPADVSVSRDQTHEVELKLAGYDTAKATIDQNSSDDFPPIKLAAVQVAPGKITYDGEYPVSIYNGKTLVMNATKGKTVELPAGVYSLRLFNTKNVLIRSSQTVEVKPGETATIQGPEMGTLNVTAQPGGFCKIFVDSEYSDSPPIQKLPVQAGPHEIKISWEKLQKEKSLSVNVVANQVTTVKGIVSADNVDIFEVPSQ